MGETYQLAMWEIGRTPTEPDSPSPPLPGHYSWEIYAFGCMVARGLFTC